MTIFHSILAGCFAVATVQASAADAPPKIVHSAPLSAIAARAGAQLTASNDGSEVAMKLAHELSDIRNVRATFATSALIVEAPLSKGRNSQDLFTSDGFGNATRLGLSYTNFSTGVAQRSAQHAVEFDRYCTEMRQAAKTSPARPVATDPTTLACDAENFSLYLKEKWPLARTILPLPLPGGILWGVQAKIGTQDDTHADPVSFARSAERNYPWSAGLYVGYIPSTINSLLFLAKLDRKQVYRSADETVRCPASTTGGPFSCVTGSFAPPESVRGTSAGLEARYLIRPNIGMSLLVVRDTGNDRTSIELPLYLVSSSAGDLNGGIKIGWNSGDKKTVLSVFVGVPFSAWPF